MKVSLSKAVACTALACAALSAIFAFGEFTHWTSSRRRLGDPSGGDDHPEGAHAGDEQLGKTHVGGFRSKAARLPDVGDVAGHDQIIVVLGYRNGGEHANTINRFRIRAGLRTIDPRARSVVLILCGGAVAGQTPEALILERCAREELGFTGRALLETQSSTTWENIVNAVPLIDEELKPGSTISIVSNSHHAEKARDHLWQQRPDLARRLVRGGDYRFAELPVIKPIAAVRGLAALRELDRSKQAAQPG